VSHQASVFLLGLFCATLGVVRAEKTVNDRTVLFEKEKAPGADGTAEGSSS